MKPVSNYYWCRYKTDQERAHKRATIEAAVWMYVLRKECFRATEEPEARKVLRRLSSLQAVADEFGISRQTLVLYKQRMKLEGRLPAQPTEPTET